MSGESVSRYLAQLGLKPGATMQQINAKYYFLLKKFSEKDELTERDEQIRGRIQHGYNVLKRAYTSKAPTRAALRQRENNKKKNLAKPVLPIAALSLVLLVAGGALAGMHFQTIKFAFIQFEEGDVVKWQDSREPYGQIVRFDPEHKFQVGSPVPAYEIQLSEKDETIWITERIVHKKMERIDWKP